LGERTDAIFSNKNGQALGLGLGVEHDYALDPDGVYRPFGSGGNFEATVPVAGQIALVQSMASAFAPSAAGDSSASIAGSPQADPAQLQESRTAGAEPATCVIRSRRAAGIHHQDRDTVGGQKALPCLGHRHRRRGRSRRASSVGIGAGSPSATRSADIFTINKIDPGGRNVYCGGSKLRKPNL
jgi:hypothetical protein